jgi:hypothetical protein
VTTGPRPSRFRGSLVAVSVTVGPGLAAALFAVSVAGLTHPPECEGDSHLRDAAFQVGLVGLVLLGVGLVVSVVVLILGRHERRVTILGATGIAVSLVGGGLASVGARSTFDVCFNFM